MTTAIYRYTYRYRHLRRSHYIGVRFRDDRSIPVLALPTTAIYVPVLALATTAIYAPVSALPTTAIYRYRHLRRPQYTGTGTCDDRNICTGIGPCADRNICIGIGPCADRNIPISVSALAPTATYRYRRLSRPQYTGIGNETNIKNKTLFSHIGCLKATLPPGPAPQPELLSPQSRRLFSVHATPARRQRTGTFHALLRGY